MSKEEKRKLQVSNIFFYHNAFMILDKECKVDQLAKVYKETNKEREEWRASVQRQKNKKQKRAAVVIIQKHIQNYYSLLLSYNVVASKWVQEKDSKGFNKRIRNCLLNLFVIRGQNILKRE
jgi:uncharacterized protein YdaU (DUF1376 family)